METKKLITKTIYCFGISQFISIMEVIQIALPKEIFCGIGDIIFASIPTNMVFWYILISIYQIVFKNIEILKYTTVKSSILFYVDYVIKLIICIFAALFYGAKIDMAKIEAGLVCVALIAADIFIEIATIIEFNKLNKEGLVEKNKRVIVVEPLKCTQEEFHELDKKILQSMIVLVFPFIYMFLYDNMECAFAYCCGCISIHYGFYKTFKKHQEIFERPKYIYRVFFLEMVIHISIFFLCAFGEEAMTRNYIIYMGIVMNIYWFLRIEYQMVKTSRRMEKYLQNLNITEK